MTNKTILTATAAFLIAFGLFITWAVSITPTKEEAEAKSMARLEQREKEQNERIDSIVASMESNNVARIESERIATKKIALEKMYVENRRLAIEREVWEAGREAREMKMVREFRRDLDDYNRRHSGIIIRTHTEFTTTFR